MIEAIAETEKGRITAAEIATVAAPPLPHPNFCPGNPYWDRFHCSAQDFLYATVWEMQRPMLMEAFVSRMVVRGRALFEMRHRMGPQIREFLKDQKHAAATPKEQR